MDLLHNLRMSKDLTDPLIVTHPFCTEWDPFGR
jgi:hypothetical protein